MTFTKRIQTAGQTISVYVCAYNSCSTNLCVCVDVSLSAYICNLCIHMSLFLQQISVA